jgi:hypothetical protein
MTFVNADGKPVSIVEWLADAVFRGLPDDCGITMDEPGDGSDFTLVMDDGTIHIFQCFSFTAEQVDDGTANRVITAVRDAGGVA